MIQLKLNDWSWSQNILVRLEVFLITLQSFPPVISWCCFLLLLSRPYSFANSCRHFDNQKEFVKCPLILSYSYYATNDFQTAVFLFNSMIKCYDQVPCPLSHRSFHSRILSRLLGAVFQSLALWTCTGGADEHSLNDHEQRNT